MYKRQAFPRISFQLTVKGASEMKYKIVEKKAFQVYGIEEIFDTRDGENLKDVYKRQILLIPITRPGIT